MTTRADVIKRIEAVDARVRKLTPLWESLPALNGIGEVSFAELLVRADPKHENNRIDQIEKAIGG